MCYNSGITQLKKRGIFMDTNIKYAACMHIAENYELKFEIVQGVMEDKEVSLGDGSIKKMTNFQIHKYLYNGKAVDSEELKKYRHNGLIIGYDKYVHYGLHIITYEKAQELLQIINEKLELDSIIDFSYVSESENPLEYVTNLNHAILRCEREEPSEHRDKMYAAILEEAKKYREKLHALAVETGKPQMIWLESGLENEDGTMPHRAEYINPDGTTYKEIS